MAKKQGYYRANQGFATVFDGENVFVQKGELVSADHPLLKGREGLFDHVTSFGRFDTSEVEQATAAPGEKRGRRATPQPEPVKDEKPAEKPSGLTTADIQPGSTRGTDA
jgi:hypothetical protein